MNMTYVLGTIVSDLQILILHKVGAIIFRETTYRKVTEKVMEPEFNPAP